MHEKQTLFVDYESRNTRVIRDLIEAMKSEDVTFDLSDFEKRFDDMNVYAVLGYALHHGFHGISRDPESSERVLAKGIARDITSSYFVSGVILVNGRDRDEGMNLIELAASRDYPPALYMLGINHIRKKWRNSSDEIGYWHLSKAAKLSFLPAKLVLYDRQCQPPYKRRTRLKSIIQLFLTLSTQRFLLKVDPLSKLVTYFKSL